MEQETIKSSPHSRHHVNLAAETPPPASIVGVGIAHDDSVSATNTARKFDVVDLKQERKKATEYPPSDVQKWCSKRVDSPSTSHLMYTTAPRLPPVTTFPRPTSHRSEAQTEDI